MKKKGKKVVRSTANQTPLNHTNNAELEESVYNLGVKAVESWLTTMAEVKDYFINRYQFGQLWPDEMTKRSLKETFDSEGEWSQELSNIFWQGFLEEIERLVLDCTEYIPTPAERLMLQKKQG